MVPPIRAAASGEAGISGPGIPERRGKPLGSGIRRNVTISRSLSDTVPSPTVSANLSNDPSGLLATIAAALLLPIPGRAVSADMGVESTSKGNSTPVTER